MFSDHTPQPVNKFLGLYASGAMDSVPLDHAYDAQNNIYTENGVLTRHGSVVGISTFFNIRRWFVYKRLGEASRLLILDTNGNIYDSTNLAVPILTVMGMTDFSFVNFNNRAYISPHNGTEGLPGQVISVYDGFTCRPAGGTAPVGSLTLATSASSGFVEAGLRLFAVAYETASGYITQPGPAIFTAYAAPGGFKIDVSTIPIGPAGVVARRILATKRIIVYDGNQLGQEYFFVPGGRIPDNVSTTLTIDFFDVDLVSSADYLFDQRATIPACLFLSTYKNRLVAGNYDGGNSVVLFSKANEPESFNEVTGFQVIEPTESTGVKNGIEFRDTFYMFKSLRAGATLANDLVDASSWAYTNIDRGAGTEVFGVSRILDSQGTNTDKFLIADKSGLLIFDGVTRQPALTWKVKNVWSRINAAAGNEIQVFNDPTDSMMYVSLPLDGAIKPNFILVGDYSNGMDPINIKWDIWSFPQSGLSIGIDIDNATQIPYLRFGSTSGNIYNVDKTVFNDSGSAIVSRYEQVIKSGTPGAGTHLGGLQYRAVGSGALEISLFSMGRARNVLLANTTLASNPDLIYQRQPTFEAQKIFVRWECATFNSRYDIRELIYHVKPSWAVTPA
jgi:hypothetical protein